MKRLVTIAVVGLALAVVSLSGMWTHMLAVDPTSFILFAVVTIGTFGIVLVSAYIFVNRVGTEPPKDGPEADYREPPTDDG
jgi:hypothetical protein